MIMIGKNGNKVTSSQSPNSILLVDSSLIISEIKKIYDDSFALIVSFDYNSHKKLEQNHIPHKRSEEFISEHDIDEIQEIAYKLIYWYDQNEIKNLIEYDSINLGKLFHEETMDYLIKFLKHFFEIKRIHTQYPNALFFTSPKFSVTIKIFTNHIKQLTSSTTNLQNYANDQIRVNFNIGKKYFMFFISKSTYQKIKQIYDHFVHFIMGPKSFNLNMKNVLLVEFNTVRYEELFLAKKPSSLNLFFYGRRRPAFWNFNSFSIFKKSKAKIVSSHAIDHKKPESNVLNSITSVKNNIQSLLDDEEFFSNFFRVENISIWDAIKPTLFELLENRIEKTIYEIELCKEIFDKYNFDSVLLMSEIGFTEQIVINQAKKHNIPSVLIQPGLYNDTIEANKNNISKGVYPIVSDKILVWGNIPKKDTLENAKIPIAKIEVIGSPRYSKKKLSVPTVNEDYILLATSAPQPADIHGLISENVEKYEKSIISISKIASKLKKKLIIKLHPSPNESDIKSLISGIDHDIIVITSGDIFPLIQSCSVMIVLGLSTAIVEAQLLHKPVISVPVIDYKWGESKVFTSNSVIVSDLFSLEDNLNNILEDQEFRNNVIKNANNFLGNYIVNIGHGPEKTLGYLSTL
jgi:hypothetical protein